MEKELVNKELGGDLDLKIDFKDGKLMVSIVADMKGADLGLSVAVDSDYFLDKLAKAIPGEIDDAVIGMIKTAF